MIGTWETVVGMVAEGTNQFVQCARAFSPQDLKHGEYMIQKLEIKFQLANKLKPLQLVLWLSKKCIS